MDNEIIAARFAELISLVAALRSPGGCPWDRAQTLGSIAPYLLEETHETIEAIHTNDSDGLRDELGDLLLEVALLARISEEAGTFTIADSLEAINAKLVRRHPHVFGGDEDNVSTAEAVNKRWSEIKAKEKPHRKALDGVPITLPALHRARRVSEKAAAVGFDWPGPEEVLDKVEEECGELRAELSTRDHERLGEELGDMLFALVNLARHLKLDPEKCLNSTTDKFLSRFSHVEESLKASGRGVSEASAEELDGLWNEAKNIEKS